jgi:hypothetical protein
MDSVAICNMTLDAIGSTSSIATLTEQSAEAAACNRHYEQTTKELMRLFDWPFTRANEALAVLLARSGTPENPDGTTVDEPEWPWSYAYSMPELCLKPRFIVPQATSGSPSIDGVPLTTSDVGAPLDIRTPTIKFIQGTVLVTTARRRVIFTNQYQARLVYTAYVSDPDMWDAGFVTALIGRLAQKICMPLSGDKSLMKMAAQAGAIAESEAKAATSNEGITVIDWTPESVAAHGYSDPDNSSLYQGNSAVDIS